MRRSGRCLPASPAVTWLLAPLDRTPADDGQDRATDDTCDAAEEEGGAQPGNQADRPGEAMQETPVLRRRAGLASSRRPDTAAHDGQGQAEAVWQQNQNTPLSALPATVCSAGKYRVSALSMPVE